MRLWVQYLQCTTRGPGQAVVLMRRVNPSSPVAWYGTPWSGQPVKWNCLISLISWTPRWTHRERDRQVGSDR